MDDETTDETNEPAEETDATPNDGDDLDEAAPIADDFVEERREPAYDEPVRRPSRPALNQLVVGQLTIHYPERDVTTVLDGEAAVRLMAIFAGRAPHVREDLLTPEVANASNMWLVADTRTPLAMTWVPGLPAKPARTTIDPAPIPA